MTTKRAELATLVDNSGTIEADATARERQRRYARLLIAGHLTDAQFGALTIANLLRARGKGPAPFQRINIGSFGIFLVQFFHIAPLWSYADPSQFREEFGPVAASPRALWDELRLLDPQSREATYADNQGQELAVVWGSQCQHIYADAARATHAPWRMLIRIERWARGIDEAIPTVTRMASALVGFGAGIVATLITEAMLAVLKLAK